jgi:hypothetical protein
MNDYSSANSGTFEQRAAQGKHVRWQCVVVLWKYTKVQVYCEPHETEAIAGDGM